jgi:subtilisin-like proprotein convertase family protein
MRPSRPVTLVAAVAASLGFVMPVSAAPSSPTARGGLPANTAAQITALQQAKLALSPSQRKIDSRLLAESKIRRRVPLAAGVTKVATGVRVSARGLTTVDVDGRVSPALLAKVRALGGLVRTSSPAAGTLRADVPLAAVEALAASPDVANVRAADGWMSARRTPTTPAPESKVDQLPSARERLAAAVAQAQAARLGSAAVTPLVGSVTSEGDVTHAVDTTRASRQLSGIGIKIGVLSDGVTSLAASVSRGDLPPNVEVLPGQTGSGNEGTAMLEIVHDLAPKASLAFATAINSLQSFADNIRALRAAGCDIIVDDILYFAESPFQDGPIAQAVIDVTNDGALYFSSAGNEQNVDDGTAGNWEGDYVSSGQTVGKFAGFAHDFDPGAAVQAINPLSTDSVGVPAILQWNDPLGASGNDYDLYAVNATGDVIAFSNAVQNGDDNPFEGFFVPNGTLGLAIVKFSGADRYFQISPLRGKFVNRSGLVGFNTPGVTRGHSAVPAAYSVAAVPASVPFPREIAPGVPNPPGPFPGVYTSAQLSETFTSDGPRRVFYHPDGTEITPGNLTSTGGEVRAKPDIAAADGVVTSVTGFTRFFGTSASAPHAAAIAALVLSGNPGITPAEVRTAIEATALDIEASGYDRNTGHGIIMADRLLQFTGSTPQPFVVAGDPVVTPTTGDGDAFLEPGERASVAIPVTNIGDITAQGVSVALTTSTPGIVINPGSRNYGSVQAGATKTSTNPFTLRVPATHEPGVAIALHIRVSFVGALSPTRRDATVPVGEPSTEVLDVPYTGAPVPIPDNNPAGASATVSVPAAFGRISRITFSIDGTTCTTAIGATTVGLDHTFVGDLIGTLTAPDGTSVGLFSRAGGGGNNICQAVFDDTAARAFQGVATTEAPYTGRWRPFQPLAGLVGHRADGTWTFKVVDAAGADVGSIRAFSLHLSGFVQ